MRLVALIALTIAAGCSAAGSARYRHSSPPALPSAGPPQQARRVLLSFAPFTWQATAASNTDFRVYLATPGGEWLRRDRRAIGDVRSPDLDTGRDGRIALYCGWSLGQEDGCARDDAPAHGHRLVVEALALLRAQAADAGAVEVRQVRCFVRVAGRDGGTLWCEGIAFTGEPDPAGIDEPEPVVEARAAPAPSRWKLAATSSAGGYGDSAVTGTTIRLGYRGVEPAFHMVITPDYQALGLGFELLIRRQLGDDGVSLVAGVTGLLLASQAGAPEDRTGGSTRGAGGPVLGLSFQPELPWRFFGGFGKPFAELRIGWLAARRARADIAHDLAGANLELHLGFRTP